MYGSDVVKKGKDSRVIPEYKNAASSLPRTCSERTVL